MDSNGRDFETGLTQQQLQPLQHAEELEEEHTSFQTCCRKLQGTEQTAHTCDPDEGDDA